MRKSGHLDLRIRLLDGGIIPWKYPKGKQKSLLYRLKPAISGSESIGRPAAETTETGGHGDADEANGSRRRLLLTDFAGMAHSRESVKKPEEYTGIYHKKIGDSDMVQLMGNK